VFAEEGGGFFWGFRVGTLLAGEAGFGDLTDSVVDRIGHSQQVEVGGADGTLGDEGRSHVVEHRLPEGHAHEDDRELGDFSGLDEDGGLEDFVHGAKAAGHDHEGVGIFDEHDLADEEVPELDEAVKVWVGLLLHGQFDVAPEAEPIGIAGAAVGCFHDAGPPPGHDGEAGFGQGFAHVSGELVIFVVFIEAGGAEDGDARAGEVELSESADELAEDADRSEHFLASKPGPFEQLVFVASRGSLAPAQAFLEFFLEMVMVIFSQCPLRISMSLCPLFAWHQNR